MPSQILSAVVSYLVSTSNHNGSCLRRYFRQLFLISYLHQTTTVVAFADTFGSCFLSRIYIKPQPLVGVNRIPCCCFLSRIYIKPQPYLCLSLRVLVVSYLVSTSNHNNELVGKFNALVVSYLVSTSNHNECWLWMETNLVVSYLVSTSNHNAPNAHPQAAEVVSYLVSTSNHNQSVAVPLAVGLFLISYLHQTTTILVLYRIVDKLFLISYLHQTTTQGCGAGAVCTLFLISYLHQTTTYWLLMFHHRGCFLSRIYIKPQRACSKHTSACVVSYLVSTSNHNRTLTLAFIGQLFLISYLHQTTTGTFRKHSSRCCFLSRIYIKPQLAIHWEARLRVVSYLVSTSNHNCFCFCHSVSLLFLISYLHQTTTKCVCQIRALVLFLISYLHQTTTKDKDFSKRHELFLISYLHQTTTMKL